MLDKGMLPTIGRRPLLAVSAICATMLLWQKAVFAGRSPNRAPLTLTPHDTDTLVRTLYGECGGEIERGQIAVAHVVFNRVLSDDPDFAGDTTVALACHRSSQFSCWNGRHARHKLMSIRRNSDEYISLLNVVQVALHRHYNGIDVSNGATYYARVDRHPVWARHMHRTCRIGHHNFYRPLMRTT